VVVILLVDRDRISRLSLTLSRLQGFEYEMKEISRRFSDVQIRFFDI